MANLRVIHTEADRQQIIDWIKSARLKTRVEVKGPARSSEQNSRMWAMLTDIVRARKTINGKEYDTNAWKCIFMEALGHEPDILPKLNGDGFFAVDTSTSKLSEAEMSNLIEFMFAWGAENNMVWSDPQLRSQEEMMR